MVKYTQTDSELRDHLWEQIQFLRASTASFDNGFEGEAKRLATTIRVLFHDTKMSKSLLQQITMKQHLQMLDTAPADHPNNLLPYQGLVVMKLQAPPGQSASISFTILGEVKPLIDAAADRPTAKMTYVPRCSAPEGGGPFLSSEVSFTKWWEGTVIRDGSGQLFTRRDLILAMANKEGGSHVDPQLDEAYASLARFHSQGWQVNTGDVRLTPNNSIVAASVRQIAHEVLESMKLSFPDVSTKV